MPSDDAALALVARALDHGIGYFDTSHLYGGGLSEQRLGLALAHLGSDALISTKLGAYRPFGARPTVAVEHDFTAARTLESLAISHERLARDCLDVVFVHDFENHWETARDECWPVLLSQRAAGRISRVGFATTSADGLDRMMTHGLVPDVVMVAGRWTLLERQARSFLDYAMAHHITVVAAAVLNSGILATGAVPGATFNYRPATDAELARVSDLQALCGRFGCDLCQLALHFPRCHPAVTSMVIGAQDVPQLDSTMAALNAPVPPENWAAFEQTGGVIGD